MQNEQEQPVDEPRTFADPNEKPTPAGPVPADDDYIEGDEPSEDNEDEGEGEDDGEEDAPAEEDTHST